MRPDICQGAWSVDRAMVAVESWVTAPPDGDECDVTERMARLARVALSALHMAGTPRPHIWRGVSGVVICWRHALPENRATGVDFRSVTIDVEDDVDESGSVGCFMFEDFLFSARHSVIIGWNESNVDHLAMVARCYLDGTPLRWVARQLPDAIGSGMRQDQCIHYSPGPYTCGPARWRDGYDPLNGGHCAVAV